MQRCWNPRAGGTDSPAARRVLISRCSLQPRQEDSAEGTARGGEDLPEEMKDPTVQLAVELGMDPMHLAIFSGHLGGDCTSAIKALRCLRPSTPSCHPPAPT